MRNVGKYGRIGQATYDSVIQCMRFACWTPKATDTHTQEYETTVVFPRQHWLRERASMLRLYVHCLSCFIFQRARQKKKLLSNCNNETT